MLSNKPYLLRAFYDWIVDSACTPIVVLDATNPRCKIPRDLAEDGEIVFNLSRTAIRDLKITNELIEFSASFSGVIHLISAPIHAVLAIYAEENGEGLYFDGDETSSGDTDGSMHLSTMEGTVTTAPSIPLHETSARDSAAKTKPLLTLVE